MDEIERYLQTNIEFTPAVVCYLIKDRKVLLGLRKKVSLGLGANLVAGIGGKVGDSLENQNETHEQAIIRECKEEIGVTIIEFRDMGQVKFIFPHKPKWNQKVTIYVVTKWEEIPIETEAIKPEWFEISKLPIDKMWDDNSYWLPRILSGEKVYITFLYDENGKVKSFTNN